eukprot:Phypoly_transcript_12546.p1 GENE.Phypoly_transcript_12546~~Phypoly_transcript_12546.p1  ORF type:complete len:312 (+),score=25.20 Phypoly_transcript_12546:101-1036(+)
MRNQVQLCLLVIFAFVAGSVFFATFVREVASTSADSELSTRSVLSNKFPASIEYQQHANYSGLAQSPSSRNFTQSDPTVCVVIRTYAGHRSSLPGLITSLASNDYPNMHLYLVDTDGDFDDLPKYESLFNMLYNREFVHVTNITKQYRYERFPNFTKQDFGYAQTDLMIEQLATPGHPHKCDYFLVTNGDNLYSRDLMKHTIGFLRNGLDLVGFHFVSHYCYSWATNYKPRTGCYSQLYTEFIRFRIDLGAALFKKDRMLDLNINFIMNALKEYPDGSMSRVHILDGEFFEGFNVNGTTSTIVSAVLLVHQ